MTMFTPQSPSRSRKNKWNIKVKPVRKAKKDSESSNSEVSRESSSSSNEGKQDLLKSRESSLVSSSQGSYR